MRKTAILDNEQARSILDEQFKQIRHQYIRKAQDNQRGHIILHKAFEDVKGRYLILQNIINTVTIYLYDKSQRKTSKWEELCYRALKGETLEDSIIETIKDELENYDNIEEIHITWFSDRQVLKKSTKRKNIIVRPFDLEKCVINRNKCSNKMLVHILKL